jgi:very-short-patch-repair endonuclease
MGRWQREALTEGYLAETQTAAKRRESAPAPADDELAGSASVAALKGSPGGIQFRKQHSIGDYFLDFYVARLRLAIEVDGISHDMGDRPLRDEARDAFLRGERIEVLRIPATDVLKSPEDVAESLVLYCAAKTPPSAA